MVAGRRETEAVYRAILIPSDPSGDLRCRVPSPSRSARTEHNFSPGPSQVKAIQQTGSVRKHSWSSTLCSAAGSPFRRPPPLPKPSKEIRNRAFGVRFRGDTVFGFLQHTLGDAGDAGADAVGRGRGRRGRERGRHGRAKSAPGGSGGRGMAKVLIEDPDGETYSDKVGPWHRDSLDAVCDIGVFGKAPRLLRDTLRPLGRSRPLQVSRPFVVLSCSSSTKT